MPKIPGLSVASVSKVFSQAKESALDSLRLLENLEKETKSQILAATKKVWLPGAEERRKLTNERILTSLTKLGLATREEVETLEARIAALEAKLSALQPAKTETKAEKKSTARGLSETTTQPT
jgi:BMFP domain-containing protein YqiC